MKIALIVLAVVLVIIIAGVWLLYSNLDKIVEGTIERKGSEATGTTVSVSGVELALREGRGSINGLTVASPEGFGGGDAVSFDNITLDLDVESLHTDLIEMDEVRIIAPKVNVVTDAQGATNIDRISKNIESTTGGRSNSDGDSKRIRISKFVMERGMIDFDGTAMGIEKQSVELPGLTLDNVGGEEGATSGEIARIIMESLVRQVTGRIASSRIEGMMKEKLGEPATEKVKSLMDKITN